MALLKLVTSHLSALHNPLALFLPTPLPDNPATMAAMRTALRTAPRAQLLRPSAPRTAILGPRRAASAPARRRPADDTKSADEAEAASEDLTGDPNMVSATRSLFCHT